MAMIEIMSNSKKFTIDNREYATYELSNAQLVALLKDGTITEEDKELLQSVLLARFERVLCPQIGENEDDVFVHFFEDFVNGRMISKNRVVEKMATSHRYLQNEMFNVCLAYITKLAESCERGYYDGRNEYACKTSKIIIDNFKEKDYPY